MSVSMSRTSAASASEGTFGVAFERVAPPAASMTSLPGSVCGSATCTGRNITLHLAAQQVLHRLRGALVRDVHDLDARPAT